MQSLIDKGRATALLYQHPWNTLCWTNTEESPEAA